MAVTVVHYFLTCFALSTAVAAVTVTRGTVRLWRNGEHSAAFSSGRVQIFDNEWGNICQDRQFGANEATVICHQLGFTAASSFSMGSMDE